MKHDHPLCRPVGALLCAVGSLLIPCCSALAQNLYNPPTAAAPAVKPVPAPPAPAYPDDTPAPGPTSQGDPTAAAPPPTVATAADQLAGVSLFSVQVPPPRRFAKHDLIEIIVNEVSSENFSQSTNLKKDYTLEAELSNFPSLEAMFKEWTLREGIGNSHPKVDLTGKKETKGTGKLDRKDTITARIMATVVDVKPNGNLVLEARESRVANRETKTMVVSGTCRAEDITRSNTVLSSHLAGLTLHIETQGDVKDTGDKGWIAKLLEGIFNF